ncbi:MAG: GFA family protein [Pseudomonadales bacterium]|nr:GFA family protein [Pseudomonadales bacterium]
MSDTSLTGTCLCEAVKISTTSPLNKVEVCHCSMCRKWGSGPCFSMNAGSDVTIQGSDSIASYQSSEWAERAFCKKCGTHLYYLFKGPNHYLVTPGLFTDLNPEFDMQIFIDEKPEYYCFSNDTKNLTGEEVIAMFAEE